MKGIKNTPDDIKPRPNIEDKNVWGKYSKKKKKLALLSISIELTM